MSLRSKMSPLYRNHYYKESVRRDGLQMTPSKSWPHLFRLKFTTYEALSLPSRSSEPNSRIRTPGTRYNVINTRSFSRSNIEAHFHTAVQGHTTDPHFKNALLKNASRNDSKS